MRSSPLFQITDDFGNLIATLALDLWQKNGSLSVPVITTPEPPSGSTDPAAVPASVISNAAGSAPVASAHTAETQSSKDTTSDSQDTNAVSNAQVDDVVQSHNSDSETLTEEESNCSDFTE